MDTLELAARIAEERAEQFARERDQAEERGEDWRHLDSMAWGAHYAAQAIRGERHA